jgi:hypothetical protein
MNWFVLHPKVKALAIAVVILALGSVGAVLNNTVTFKEAAISVVTASVALVIAYLKSA